MSERGHVLQVATYNVRGCVGTDEQRSETRIAEVIAELGVDIVGLQELDRSRARSAGVDQAALIAQQLGWHWHFQPAMAQGEERYGDAILSRSPMTLLGAAVLPGEPPFFCREKRGALAMEVATDGGPVQVVNTHLGLGLDERRVQAEWLTRADWIEGRSEDVPLILLGDLNSWPGGAAHRELRSQLRDVRALVKPKRAHRTFPTRWPVLALDHIFINAALHPLSLRVHRSSRARVASDHFPLVAALARE